MQIGLSSEQLHANAGYRACRDTLHSHTPCFIQASEADTGATPTSGTCCAGGKPSSWRSRAAISSTSSTSADWVA